MTLNFTVSAKKYSICKFNVGSVLPDLIYLSDFYSITKTNDEISVVAEQTDFRSDVIVCSNGWRILKISGPLDFSHIGILAEISDIFRERKIPIFVISTYDTDHIMVKHEDINSGINALRENGHTISIET